MRGGFAALVLLAGFAPIEASPLSARGNAPHTGCAVVSGAKLLGKSGESSAICSEIERAMAAQASGVRYSVEITVHSPSRLAAQLTVNGRTLPLQNFAVMDGQLNASAIAHFAAALANVVAEAGKS